MNAKSFVVPGGALVVCLLGAVFAAGCLVEPEETTLLTQMTVGGSRPNLMLLVDTSGSMTAPVDPSLAACRTTGGAVCGGGSGSEPCNTATCPTRWSELQIAMQDFLVSSGSFARLGLALYPSNDSCGATAALTVPLPDARTDHADTLAANAQAVKNKILSIKNYSANEPMPRGGTPIGVSLQYLGSLPELQSADREDIVLLLTDGLPNCNEAYPQPYPNAGCFCTLSDCSYTKEIGCLDKDASVSAVQALRAKNIRTIVVGFGSDFDPTSELGRRGTETLNAMAEQGGFARACFQDSDCGAGDTCDTASQRCSRRFYRAFNGGELASALQRVSALLPKASCLVRFADAGAYAQESLTVSVDGQVVAPGESSWSLTSEGVLFTGTACERLEAATPSAPVRVEVRVREAP